MSEKLKAVEECLKETRKVWAGRNVPDDLVSFYLHVSRLKHGGAYNRQRLSDVRISEGIVYCGAFDLGSVDDVLGMETWQGSNKKSHVYLPAINHSDLPHDP